MPEPATWAVGDVHGCFETFARLVERIEFDPARDRLWMTGDLINHGRRSLDVLRWMKTAAERMGERFVAVLGNHDLHALACRAGVAAPRPKDTFHDLFAAPDVEDLLDWLHTLPLLHREGDTLLVHAGLWPWWTASQAERRARRIEQRLRDPEGARILLDRSGASRPATQDLLLQRDLDALTRLRALDADSLPCKFKGSPDEAPPGCVPWYLAPSPRRDEVTVLFGHWAAAGFRRAPGAVALDSGCVWGGRLSALRLGDSLLVQQDALETPR